LLNSVAPAAAVDHSADTRAITSEAVSPNFFQTVGISLINGRDFMWRDDKSSPPVTVISASLQWKLFPDGRAVGQHVRLGTDPKLRAVEVVGVVTDASIANLRDAHVGVAYRPWLQGVARIPILHVRMTRPAASVAADVQRTVRSLGHDYVRGE